MRQDAQKRAPKFCTSKRAENTKMHPKKPEKGRTGCVLGAGGVGSGWEQVQTEATTHCLNQREPHNHATHAKRKPAKTQCFRRFFGRGRRTCLGCRLGCCSPVGSAQHRPRREPRPAPGRSPPGCRPPRHALRRAQPCLVAKSYRTLTKKVRYRRSDT